MYQLRHALFRQMFPSYSIFHDIILYFTALSQSLTRMSSHRGWLPGRIWPFGCHLVGQRRRGRRRGRMQSANYSRFSLFSNIPCGSSLNIFLVLLSSSLWQHSCLLFFNILRSIYSNYFLFVKKIHNFRFHKIFFLSNYQLVGHFERQSRNFQLFGQLTTNFIFIDF